MTEQQSSCQCGCGEPVLAPKRFLRGHWSRTAAAREMYERRRAEFVPANQAGLCACGCGQPTPLSAHSHPTRGYYKGHPLRFIPGHHAKKKGPANHRWRGGRWVHPSGYVWIYAPDHPHTNAKGYVYEHRLVVEKRLNRFLDPGERVHHLNHDRGDNRDENLILFPSHSAHVQAEHRHELRKWHQAHPAASKAINSKAGKKGAAARWNKPQ